MVWFFSTEDNFVSQNVNHNKNVSIRPNIGKKLYILIVRCLSKIAIRKVQNQFHSYYVLGFRLIGIHLPT